MSDPASPVEVIAAHLPQGYGTPGWLCRCAGNDSDDVNWRDEHDHAAHVAAALEEARRKAVAEWFVPAYRADNGAVIAIGTTTVLRRHAEEELRLIKRGETPEIAATLFLASRLQPEWEEVRQPSASEEGSDG